MYFKYHLTIEYNFKEKFEKYQKMIKLNYGKKKNDRNSNFK